MWRAHRREFQCALVQHVRGKERLARCQEQSIRPRQGDADGTFFVRRSHITGFCFSAEKPPCEFDRIDDLLVPGAATEISRERILDGSGIRIGILLQKRLGGHNHSWCAKTALNGPGASESLLNKVRIFWSAKPLDGDDFRRIEVLYPSEARTHRLLVDNYRARAALPLTIAGLFRAGQSLGFSQEVQQNQVIFRDAGLRTPVQYKVHLFHECSPYVFWSWEAAPKTQYMVAIERRSLRRKCVVCIIVSARVSVRTGSQLAEPAVAPLDGRTELEATTISVIVQRVVS